VQLGGLPPRPHAVRRSLFRSFHRRP
jgi:hypothetical protein